MHMGRKDFLADERIMYLVVTGKLSRNVSEAYALRLTDAASHLRWDGLQLWFIGSTDVER